MASRCVCEPEKDPKVENMNLISDGATQKEKKHRDGKMFNRGKSHKKQIICLRMRYTKTKEIYWFIYFCAKGYFGLPGSLALALNAQKRELVPCVLFNSPHQADVKHKIYKLWTRVGYYF